MTNTRRVIRAAIAVLVLAVAAPIGVQVAQAAYVDYATYVYPSTNAENKEAGWSHVNLVSRGPGTVTLEFVQPRGFLAYFEYRIDGQLSTSVPHFLFGFTESQYPGVGVGGGYGPGPVVKTLPATATVEIRLALGDENDERFDWITFVVGPPSKDACKKGGWQTYEFTNQGQCIAWFNRQ